MSALVERIIAARDRLKGFAVPSDDDEHEAMPPGCVNHDDRVRVTNLDGDNLCQECADAWCRAEGQWQHGQPE